MAEFLVEEIRASFQRTNKPLVICGAGVSIQASDGLAPSWLQLIEKGIQRATDLGMAHDTWAAYARHRIEYGNAAAWVEVADELTAFLGGGQGREFSVWIEENISSIAAIDTRLVDAIAGLNAPIATTNYDDILSRVTQQPVIYWDDYAQVAAFLKGERNGILHLHGHWRRPETIILGSSSYNKLNQEPRRTLLQQLGALTRPSFLIGCSQEGMSDPDFAKLNEFVTEWPASTERRYWLVRNSIATDEPKAPLSNFYPIPFGDRYEELPPFLERLSPCTAANTSPRLIEIRAIDDYQPRPQIFGRADEVKRIVNNILNGVHTIVAGAPGMGKTALATEVCYRDEVVAKYGRRRIFVSLDEVEDARSIAVQIVDALGLQPTGDVPTLLHQIAGAVADAPFVIVIDNAEAVFEENFEEAERVLRLIAQRPQICIVLTLRGTAPNLPMSDTIDDLVKLDEAASRQAFLTVSGERFASDPELPELIGILEGHPLSIELMAARARDVSALIEIRRMWEAEHAEILRRPGAREGRLTSVRASLALSINSPRMRNSRPARKLLEVLSVLPDGALEQNVPRLLGSPAQISRSRAAEAVTTLRGLRLIEARTGSRVRMLNPLRESVRLHKGFRLENIQRTTRYMMKLAEQGNRAYSSDWGKVRASLEGEAGNLEYVAGLLTRQSVRDNYIPALIGLLRFIQSSGRSIPLWYNGVVDQCVEKGNFRAAADLSNEMAEVEKDHSNFYLARKYAQEALIYSQRSGSKIGRGNALSGLGEVAMILSNHREAREDPTEALGYYRAAGNSLGIANTSLELANLAYREGRVEQCVGLLDTAEELYMENGGERGAPFGMANSLMLRAKIDEKDSGEILARALVVLEETGPNSSRSSCIIALGIRELRRRNYEEARKLFREAKNMARSSASVANEAAATILEGWTFQISEAHDIGTSYIEEGFKLWFQVLPEENAARPGWEAMQRALLADDLPEREKYLSDAETCWVSIGRLDLIEEWASLERWLQELDH